MADRAEKTIKTLREILDLRPTSSAKSCCAV
jgi:hypothetical protein